MTTTTTTTTPATTAHVKVSLDPRDAYYRPPYTGRTA